MTIPSNLGGWNLNLVTELCQLGQIETDRHDFKFGLPDADTLTKLCCAFANSRGGFFVLGVKQLKGHFLPKGLDPDPDIANKFGSKLKATPTISFSVPYPIPVISAPKLIYVIEIPRSPDRPHFASDRDKRVFWKRTNSGCEQMTLEEIRAEFINYEERREKIKSCS